LSAGLRGALPLLLVGAGKMGGAMLDRWLQSGADGRQVAVLDPAADETRRADWLSAGVSLTAGVGELGGRSFGTIVLAVKPQTMPDVLSSLAPLAGPDTLIVSVAAGVRLEKLRAPFKTGQAVVRAMPNTPAQIGQGMTVAIAGGALSEEQRAASDALLRAVGEVAWVEDEELMDAVTAVSGSGPAYVFLLAECLAEAGRQAGLPEDLAELLARRTVSGAGALLAASSLPPAVLRQNVTSPGGTTAAALSVLMAEDGLQPLLTRAVAAAKGRSVELG
jgi:pyrroline-5-carboxylate reductase